MAAAGGTITRVVRVKHQGDVFLVSPGDPGVAIIAARQHGAISVEQLYALGFGRGAVRRRVERGRLHARYRGVYAVGHGRLGSRGELWAALLACGGIDAAVLSHRTAAGLWDLMPPPAGAIDVTSLRRSASVPGLRVHRSRTLTPAEITTLDGLPITTPSRTLIDLQDQLTPHRLRRVVHRAEHLRLLDAGTLTPSPGRRSRALRAAAQSLATHDPKITRTEIEERFLALVDHAGLPEPQVNTLLHGYEVDFLWPAHHLIAETDGAATHLTATAFETDRARDAALLLHGYRVVRFTWRQVIDQPQGVAAILAGLLA